MTEPTGELANALANSEPETVHDGGQFPPDEQVAAESHQGADSSPDETTERPKGKEELYRKQRGELKAQNEQLVERLNRMQRAEVERLAADHLEDGADIWRDGAELADALDDEGNIDSGKISELCNALHNAHPHWKRRGPAAPPASTVTARGKIHDAQPPQATWTQLLQGRVEQR